MRRSTKGRRIGHIIGSVYLVHFARSHRGARHYLGFSTNIPARVKAHRAGRGAPLLGAITRRHIAWRVVRTWRRKDGFFEQRLKRSHALRDLCPACNGPRAYRKGR
jgi:predicted GIY-YIG superfamily endonuclease